MPEPTLIAERPANLDLLIEIPDHVPTSWKQYSVSTLLCNGRVETQYASGPEDLMAIYYDRLVDLTNDYAHAKYHSRIVVAVIRDLDGHVETLLQSGEWSCQEGHSAA